MGKTLFFSNQALSPMHQAAESELIRLRLDAGHDVHVLHCEAALRTCALNQTHNLLGCATCAYRSAHLAHLAGVPTENRHTLDERLFPDRFPEPFPTTLAGLMDYHYEGVNIGRGAAASAISTVRDTALDGAGEHREMFELQLCNALGALRNFRRLLDRLQPDEVVLFNGRHAESRPLVELCEQQGLNFVCHERGGSIQLYQPFRNNLPHSIRNRRKLIQELWDSYDPARAREQAIGWYESKRVGRNTDDKSYVGDMASGKLPDHWDAKKHNIVVFNSSEDEMKSIAEWNTPLFDSQNDVIADLVTALAERPDVHLYVRMHPNLGKLDNQQTRELRALKADNFTLIPGPAPVDSYSLAEAADVVLIFASTIGVEATYWGTASILYGPSFYAGDDAVYEPRSFSELLDLLTTPGLPAKPRENTYKYGLFISRNGREYQHAEVNAANDAMIFGERVYRTPPAALPRVLKYLATKLKTWRSTHRTVMGRPLRLSELTKLYGRLRR